MEFPWSYNWVVHYVLRDPRDCLYSHMLVRPAPPAEKFHATSSFP